jgi:hypothetical protein
MGFVASPVVISQSGPTLQHQPDLEFPMTCLLRRILASLVTVLVAAHAHAYEAGWTQIQTAGTTPDVPTTTVVLCYPTMAAPRAIAIGPFALEVAIGGEPVDKVSRARAGRMRPAGRA